MSLNVKEKMRVFAVVGAGGAGFPSYAKLAEGADTLVINASECEPLLDTDYILMREHMAELLDGAALIMEETGIGRTLLCLKEHNAHRLSLTEGQTLAKNVFVKVLPDVYPIGDEIATIYQATGRLVRPGNLPITRGVIVYNVETLINVSHAVREDKPVTRKWLTVGGAVAKPVVVRVPVGMRVRELFRILNVTVPEGYAVIDGGPSMGQIINPNIDVVKKSTKGLLILPELIPAVSGKLGDFKTQIARASSMCCQCTRCTDMCPRNLMGYPIYPHKMVRTAAKLAEMTPDMILSASLCCSCGICETAACCQGISPRNVINEFKKILGKNRMKYVGNEDVVADEYRDSRLIPISNWKGALGVTKYDKEAELLSPIEKVSAVEIGLGWHIGAPAKPVVQVGDTVKKGDKIADAADGLSVPAYASVDGRVTYAQDGKVVIECV